MSHQNHKQKITTGKKPCMLSNPAVIHITYQNHNRKCHRYPEYLPDPCNISIAFTLFQKECCKNSTQDLHQSDHQNCFPRHLRSVDLIHLHTNFNRVAHLLHSCLLSFFFRHPFCHKSLLLIFNMIFYFPCNNRTHFPAADLTGHQFQIITPFQNTHLRSPVK